MSIKPILHLPFNGNANDISGNGYHGTVVGATLTEDQWGNPNNAYNITADSQYILLENVLTNVDNWTILIIFNNIDTILWRNLISWGDGKTRIELAGADGRFRVYDGLSDTLKIGVFQNGMYHCMGLTYTPTLFSSFKNGIIQYSGAPTTPLSESDNIYLGSRTNGYKSMRVKISEFRIYDQALTPTQVKKVSQDMMRKVGRQ